LDDPVEETLYLLNLEEFTELLNWCADVTVRYLHAKIQGLHKFLRAAHEEIGDMEVDRP